MIVEAGGAFNTTVGKFLMELCDPSALAGEQGYYLTAFEAALQYIKGADVDAMQKQFEQNYGADKSSKAVQYHTRSANTVTLASPIARDVGGRWSKPSVANGVAQSTSSAKEKSRVSSKKEKKSGTSKKKGKSKSKKSSSKQNSKGAAVQAAKVKPVMDDAGAEVGETNDGDSQMLDLRHVL